MRGASISPPVRSSGLPPGRTAGLWTGPGQAAGARPPAGPVDWARSAAGTEDRLTSKARRRSPAARTRTDGECAKRPGASGTTAATQRGPRMSRYRIAVIPGDGIGREVVPEGIRVVEAAAPPARDRPRLGAVPLELRDVPHRRLDDAPRRARPPRRVRRDLPRGGGVPPGCPTTYRLWGLLIPIRRRFRQYVNLRPVRVLAGMVSPLRDRGPEDIDFYVVRENNEGEVLRDRGPALRG